MWKAFSLFPSILLKYESNVCRQDAQDYQTEICLNSTVYMCVLGLGHRAHGAGETFPVLREGHVMQERAVGGSEWRWRVKMSGG